jgi:hypothetical protein
MKNVLSLLGVLGVSMPFAAGAVTWTMESGEFSFPETAVHDYKTAPSLSFFSCRAETRTGITRLFYVVPPSTKGATMGVYNAAGALVASYELTPGGGSMRLHTAGHPVAAGVYCAVIRYGSVEKTTRFSIVK